MGYLVDYIRVKKCEFSDTLNKNWKIHMMLDNVCLVEVNQVIISLVIIDFKSEKYEKYFQLLLLHIGTLFLTFKNLETFLLTNRINVYFIF